MVIPQLHEFYGECKEGWKHLPEFWLNRYVEEMPKIKAEKEMRLFNLLTYIFPSRSKEEVKIREDFVKSLNKELGDYKKPKSQPPMSVLDWAHMLANTGMPVEIIQHQNSEPNANPA